MYGETTSLLDLFTPGYQFHHAIHYSVWFTDMCASFLNKQKRQNLARVNEIVLHFHLTPILINHILILSKVFPLSNKELV